MTQVLTATAAAIRTITAYVVIASYILLAGPPGMLWALVTGKPDLLYTLSAFGVRMGLFITGIRYVVLGPGRVDRARAAIYCVNHASNVEPPIVFLTVRTLFPRLKMIYKKEVGKLPIFGKVLEIGRFVPIDRNNREQSARALEQAARQMNEDGDSFVVFPEGTRSRSGELQPFKKGAFLLALMAQKPIVPMAIIGARGAMRKGSPWIWPTNVTVRFAAVVETAGLTLDDRDALIERVRNEIAAMLAAGPATSRDAPIEK